MELAQRQPHRVFSGARWRQLGSLGGADRAGHWTVPAKPRRLTTGADLQAHASIVRGTLLVFSSLTQTVNVWSVPLHANSGRVIGPPRKVTATSTLQWWPSASVDGRRLVFRGGRLGSGGIWMRDLETDARFSSSRPSEPSVQSSPPTGLASLTSIAEKNRAIYAVPSSGGVAEKLCGDCGDGWVYLEDWSRDRTRLLYETGRPAAVFVLDLRSGTKRLVLQRAPNDLWQARFSPDDRWIAVLEPFDSEGARDSGSCHSSDGSLPSADEWMPSDWRSLGRQAALVA